MKLSAFWKGLFMGIIGLIATLLSDTETLNIAYIIITTLVFTGQYVVKNALMPSMSEKLTLNTKDFISGLLTAVFMGISVYAGTLLTDVPFTMAGFFKAIGVAFAGYFVKTFPSETLNVTK